MGGKLTFKVSDIMPLVEHARDAKEHRAAFEQAAEPGLFLAKDDGIYLMSTGLPPLTQDKEDTSPDQTKNRVVYATGLDPYKSSDVWEKTHEISGDDFCDLIPLSHFEKPIALGAKTITIVLSESDLVVEYQYSPPKKSATAKPKAAAKKK